MNETALSRAIRSDTVTRAQLDSIDIDVSTLGIPDPMDDLFTSVRFAEILLTHGSTPEDIQSTLSLERHPVWARFAVTLALMM